VSFSCFSEPSRNVIYRDASVDQKVCRRLVGVHGAQMLALALVSVMQVSVAK
jgi:hypothetical protein